MEETIKAYLRADGTETMTVCILCELDNRMTCHGEQITLMNNHVKQNVIIYKHQIDLFDAKHQLRNPDGLYVELFKTNDEIYIVKEFRQWLEDNGYVEHRGAGMCPNTSVWEKKRKE